jgi:hypothetical protein
MMGIAANFSSREEEISGEYRNSNGLAYQFA